MEIRRLGGNDYAEADSIWLQAFQSGTRSALAGMDRYRGRLGCRLERFGLWDASGMQATFELVRSGLHFGPETVLPAGYIASIACLPAGRGRGYGAESVRYLLKYMRDAGLVVSTLQPFRFDYYRRFGWEWISVNRFYKVPSRLLPSDSGREYVRPATTGDHSRIRAAYTRFAGRYRGMAARDDAHWSCLLDSAGAHPADTYLYEREGEVEGYLILRGVSAAGTWLPEFVSQTPRAQRGLLSLLRRYEMQTANLAWKAPEGDGLWLQCYEDAIETTLGTGLQGRVVDLAGALRAWKPEVSARGTVLIELHDATAPWNHGVRRITFDVGSVSVCATTAESQVQMDVQAFSQAYFGAVSVPALRQQERLHVRDEAGYCALCSLLAGPPAWTLGDF